MVASSDKYILFLGNIRKDWAKIDPDLDPNEMAKIKIAFIENITNNPNDYFLRKHFEPFGKL